MSCGSRSGARSLWIVLALLFVGSSVAMILPDLLDDGPTKYEVATDTADRPAASDRLPIGPPRRRPRPRRPGRYRTVTDRAEARALVDDGDVDLADPR